MAAAAAGIDPPSKRMASDFIINALNHSSALAATVVHGTITTMVAPSDTSYAARLAAAMKHAKVSAQDLADHLDVTYQAVMKLLNGKSTEMTASNNMRAAKFLGVDSDWLASAEGLASGLVIRKAAGPDDPPAAQPLHAAEPARGGVYSLLASARTIADELTSADDLTREQAGPLLRRLADRPDDVAATIEMLRKVIGTGDGEREGRAPASEQSGKRRAAGSP